MGHVLFSRDSFWGRICALQQRRPLRWLLVFALVTFGCLRIAATYNVFTQTADEPIHIVCGMQWWEEGRYSIEHQHPPLARIAAAVFLYLDGHHLPRPNEEISGGGDSLILKYPVWMRGNVEGNTLLHSRGEYERNLSLARAGNLPFYIGACILVWYWAYSLSGATAGFCALLLFSTLPPILAHSSLATTDMALTATCATAIYVFSRWLAAPNKRSSVLLGLSLGLAVLSKFSAIVFLPASVFFITSVWWISWRRSSERRSNQDLRFLLRLAGLVGLVALITIWAGYRFAVDPITTGERRPHPSVDRIVGMEGFWHDVSYRVVEADIYPLASLMHGVLDVWKHNRIGHYSYFLGETRTHGWWYFFPVLLIAKTPIPFLLLTFMGALLVTRRFFEDRNLLVVVPVLAALGILLVSLPANINIGLRHVLVLYPLLAVVAGFAAAALLGSRRWKGLLSGFCLTLVVWQFVDSNRAHPDYLPYFNELARTNPSSICVDSDLDWGQDFGRLKQTVAEMEIEQISLAYFGGAALLEDELPRYKILWPYEMTSGWVAVSETFLKHHEGYHWLEAYRPVRLIGKSIRLLYIDSDEPFRAGPSRFPK